MQYLVSLNTIDHVIIEIGRDFAVLLILRQMAVANCFRIFTHDIDMEILRNVKIQSWTCANKSRQGIICYQQVFVKQNSKSLFVYCCRINN